MCDRSASASLIVAVLLVASCATRQPDPEWTANAPEWVLSRLPLPSCGEERYDAANVRFDVAIRQCLLDAYQSRDEAEMVSIESRGGEGRLVRIYRVYADGAVELLARLPADEFGPDRWERLRCQGLAPVDEVMGPTQLPGDQVFLAGPCDPVPVE